MAYNNERKGFETVDGNLIRVSGNENARINIYKGDERQKGDYSFAYNRYKNSVLLLEEQFVKTSAKTNKVKIFNLKLNN